MTCKTIYDTLSKKCRVITCGQCCSRSAWKIESESFAACQLFGLIATTDLSAENVAPRSDCDNSQANQELHCQQILGGNFYTNRLGLFCYCPSQIVDENRDIFS